MRTQSRGDGGGSPGARGVPARAPAGPGSGRDRLVDDALGTVHGSTSVPAYPASHGCVRVTVPVMDRLWGLLTIGTRVSVYRT